MKEDLLPDFLSFGSDLIESKDLDPAYPILKGIIEAYGMEPEQALRFSFRYLAYYNLASAMFDFHWNVSGKFFAHIPKLDIATERRGLRGPGKIGNHIEILERQFERNGGFVAFFSEVNNAVIRPETRFDHVFNMLQLLPDVGRWAAFKMCEILKEVHGFQIEAPDLRLKFCSGPKEGLKLLLDVPYDNLDLLEGGARRLYVAAKEAGKTWSWFEFETVLCKFHSLYTGSYYVGHDIDEQLIQIEKLKKIAFGPDYPPKKVIDVLLEMRVKTFDKKYLAEFGGGAERIRSGVLKGAYMRERMKK